MSLLKEALIKEIAEQMELPIELVTAVIAFQGEDAAKAAHIHNEIEFSGFGKFLLSQPRTKRKLKFMEDKLNRGEVKEEALEKYLIHIEALKKRINE